MTEWWRPWALSLLALGIVGVAVELLLLGHFEDTPQWTPLVLLGLGLVASAAALVRPGPGTLRLLRTVMGAFIVAAAAGVYFHLKSNVEFELELRPTIGGRELVWESLRGAMPALAPGAMAQLGLLGLLATLRHPLLSRPGPEPDPTHGENR